MEQQQLTPKAAEKRAAILKHAVRVFAKEGFRNTDVQTIADLAGVGKGTVYRHFGNKEQFFLTTARFCQEQLRDYVRGKVGNEMELPGLIAQEGATVILRRIAVGCAEFYQENPQTVEIMIQERAEFRESVVPSHLAFRAESRGGFEHLVQTAMERGEFRSVDVVQATNAFADLIYGSVVNGCLEGGHKQLVDRVNCAIDIYLHGLVAAGQAVHAASDTHESDTQESSGTEGDS